MTRFFKVFLFCFLPVSLWAQADYTTVYGFLNLPSSAYAASLGGSPIVSADTNVNLFLVNPALLKNGKNHQVGINYTNVSPGLNMGMVAWGYDSEKLGNVGLAIQYMNFGQIDRYDEFGTSQGTFSGGDYAFVASWSQLLIEDLRLGVNAKLIHSKIDQYNATAAAFDAGITYHNQELLLTASVLAKNIGRQIDEYIDGEKEHLPRDYQLGIAKKLAHAPFRFSLVVHHLHDANLIIKNYNTVTPNNTDLEPDELETDYLNKNSEKLMRHLIFGVEFLPGKKFSARAGYNYYRRSTMKMIEKGGLVGFSLGATILVKGLYIDYAYTASHLAGGINQISIRTNTSRFF